MTSWYQRIQHLIENPVVREAFFPSGHQALVVEPALEADGPAIRNITARHDGARARAIVALWWETHTPAFRAARDRYSDAVASSRDQGLRGVRRPAAR
jgi:hypothetical protein